LSIMAADEGKAEEKLGNAVVQLSGLIGEIGGRVVVFG
jgi:hypothetical protein